MDNDLIEVETIKFLGLVYSGIPSDVINRWGMNRYKRFKTNVWKYIQTTTDLKSFVSNFFQYYTQDNNILSVCEFVNTCLLDKEIFGYLRDNLTILIGRMQYDLKKKQLDNQPGEKKNDL